jgi:hypothetical protein
MSSNEIWSNKDIEDWADDLSKRTVKTYMRYGYIIPHCVFLTASGGMQLYIFIEGDIEMSDDELRQINPIASLLIFEGCIWKPGQKRHKKRLFFFLRTKEGAKVRWADKNGKLCDWKKRLK